MPKTIVAGTRVKPSTLANLGLLLNEKGRRPKSRADIIRRSLEVLEQIAVTKGWISPISTTNEAVGVLRSLGINLLEGADDTVESLAEMMKEEIAFPREAVGAGGTTEDAHEELMLVASQILKEIKEEEK